MTTTTTHLKVTVKRGAGVDETLMVAQHSDSLRAGPTIGPFTLADGCVYFWPGQPGRGEPVGICVGQSIVITCEVDS